MPELPEIRKTRIEGWTELIEKGESSHPTDDITLGFYETQWLNKRWQMKAGTPIPADIFYAGTIPLPCVNINIIFPLEGRNFMIQAKVAIFENIVCVPDSETVVGIMSFGTDLYKKKDWFLLKTEKDNTLTFSMDKKSMDECDNKELLCDLVARVICAWYGVQISLLHPALKYVFEHPRMAPLFAKKKKSNKKRKVGYIRKHRITMDELDKVLFPEHTQGRSHTITCPVWWVIGHWHTYNGQKKWVNGYWKGVLREARMNLDEGRDRDANICI